MAVLRLKWLLAHIINERLQYNFSLTHTAASLGDNLQLLAALTFHRLSLLLDNPRALIWKSHNTLNCSIRVTVSLESNSWFIIARLLWFSLPHFHLFTHVRSSSSYHHLIFSITPSLPHSTCSSSFSHRRLSPTITDFTDSTQFILLIGFVLVLLANVNSVS